jgi:hypothetical protein
MQKNIIKTLSYAQVFSFPLTLEEIHQQLIGKKVSKNQLKKSLLKLKIKSHQGYFYLGNINQVNSRLKNQKYFSPKINQAEKIAKILKVFPSIQAALVTGTIAAKNPQKDDDIDFLIITSHNSLWLTRLFVNLYLDILGIRRTVKSTNFSNQACLNLWLTTKTMSISRARQNLYTAHEIALALPIWDRNNTYENFLFKNKWIQKYLPNIKIPPNHIQPNASKIVGKLSFLDYLAFKLQLWYMKSNKTKETISRNLAFFHPRNTRAEIESKYTALVKINLKKFSL